MKKKLALLALIAVVMTTGIFANPIGADVSNLVKAAFTRQFEGAENVTWNITEQYIKASFVKDDQAMSAYLDLDGELLGISRNILSKQLPIGVNMELRKLLGTGWITELFEYTTGDNTSYFATIENGEQKVHLKNSGSNQWSVYKKIKKN